MLVKGKRGHWLTHAKYVYDSKAKAGVYNNKPNEEINSTMAQYPPNVTHHISTPALLTPIHPTPPRHPWAPSP